MQRPIKKENDHNQMAPPIPFKLKNKANVTLKYDFATEFNTGQFSAWLGADGEILQDGGLVLNSKTFRSMRPIDSNGYLDHFKLALYYNQVIPISRKYETLIHGQVSNKQVFNLPDVQKDRSAVPVPGAFLPRINSITEDPRLCHGQFSFFDPKTGIHAGFVLTDDMLYVLYARDESLAGCDVMCQGDLDPMAPAYTCNNYWSDPNYQLFKQNMNEESFNRFVLYVKWSDWAEQNKQDAFDWILFRKFQTNYPSICAAKLPKQAFSDWLSSNNYREYCLSINWSRWNQGYREYYSCTSAIQPNACAGDSCSTKLFGSKGNCPACSPSSCAHKYIDGSNCYANPTIPNPCCCAKTASFVDLIAVARLEACDPFCDLIDVTIGIDRGASTLNFYLGETRVYQIVNIGRRTAEQNRVLEFGGSAKTLDIASCLICFGTGNMLDAALPNNYARYRVTEKNVAVSALVPTRPVAQYRQIYRSKMGELLPVVPDQTFADPKGVNASRIWGQGDVFRIRMMSVMTRRPERGYEVSADWYKSECCGVVNCNASSASGCLSNSCEPQDDSLADYLDGRDFEIEFLQPNKPVVGDDYGLAACKRRKGAGGDVDLASGPVGEQTCVRARIVKTDQGKRYWDRNCGEDFTAIDLYQ